MVHAACAASQRPGLRPTRGSGDGAVYSGTIQVNSDAGQIPGASFGGGFNGGEFVVDVSAGNTLNIRANNVTKIVNVPSSALAAVGSFSDTEAGTNVPGQSPIGAAVLALMLAGLGVVVFRIKRSSIAA